MARFRQLKTLAREALAAPDWEARLPELAAHEPQALVGPLFGLLLDRDEDVRWRAAEGFGLTAARLADLRMEDARVLMRQFLWRLNEESGNLGWGVAESMAAAMARHEGLAAEYHRILCSYIHDETEADGNYLEHDLLRRGAYWGIARLAQARPHLAAPALPDLRLALTAEHDPANRGLAAWALGILKDAVSLPALDALAADQASFPLFRHGRVETATVGGLAAEAAAAVRPGA